MLANLQTNKQTNRSIHPISHWSFKELVQIVDFAKRAAVKGVFESAATVVGYRSKFSRMSLFFKAACSCSEKEKRTNAVLLSNQHCSPQ